MKILITGGAGFIGMGLARSLSSQGDDVVVVDHLSTQIHGQVPYIDIPEGVDFHRLDVRNTIQLASLVEDRDVIYHLAAETGTGQSMYRIQDYVSVNELGTASLLEAMLLSKEKKRKLILASSRSVYGEGAYVNPEQPDVVISTNCRTGAQLSQRLWEPKNDIGSDLIAVATSENFPIEPSSVYAATKASQELLCVAASESVNAEVSILRFQNVYGEGQSLQNPYTGIISIFFNQARQGKSISIYEDGLESRDFVHVDDVVLCLDRCKSSDLPNGEIINVGSGVGTSVIDLATTLLDVSGFDVDVNITGEYRIGDIRHCFADITKMKNMLECEPTVTLGQGLERFCDWAKTQDVYTDQSALAKQELVNIGLAV